jgi:hypothetical protein
MWYSLFLPVEVMLEVQPGIPHGVDDAGEMDRDVVDEGGDDTVSERGKIAESDVEMLDVEGATDPEDG